MASLISFYPGPSRLHPRVGHYMQEAVEKGYLSINHRSAAFVSEISIPTIETLRDRLDIPMDYTILFTSSATEGWEIIAQSLIASESLHIFNGAFGERGYHYTQNIVPTATAIRYTHQEALPMTKIKIAEHIALTHCETSNTTLVSEEILVAIRELYPDSIISLDATSTLGGITIPWRAVDVVYASVQKCLGLPAGMGLLICSPQAIAKAKQNPNKHYNSLATLHDRMQDYQTTYTTNVLNIYLLGKTLAEDDTISSKEKHLRARAAEIYARFHGSEEKRFLIQDQSLRSPTVIALQMAADRIEVYKKKALEHNMLIGNGYGAWAGDTLRIANFPQHTDAEIQNLLAIL
jgi:phosphoserine aminotransferase